MSYGVLAKAMARLRPRQQENEATEALAHILQSSPQVLRAFVTLLSQADERLASVSVSEVRTQQRNAETNAQSDLELLDGRGNVAAIVEVKLDASIHGDQLTSYLRAFGPREGSLVLLVPSGRRDIVWAAAIQRLRSAGVVGSEVRPAASAFMSTTGQRVSVVTWARVLDAVTAALPEGDRLLAADVEQLRGFIRYSEDNSFKPIQPYEVTDLNWPRRWLDYTDILDRTVARLLTSSELSFRSTASNRRLKVMGGNGWYFGWFHSNGVWGRLTLDASYWLTSGQSPFFVCFQPSATTTDIVLPALEHLKLEQPPRLFKAESGWLYVPLLPPTDVAQDDVVTSLAEQVEVVMRLVNVRKPPLTGQEEHVPSGVQEEDDEMDGLDPVSAG